MNRLSSLTFLSTLLLAPLMALSATVQTVDGNSITASMVSLKDDQLTISTKVGAKEEKKTLALGEIVEIVFSDRKPYVSSSSSSSSSSTTVRPTSSTSKSTSQPVKLINWRAELIGGDRFGGVITAWSDRRITIKPEVANTLSVDLPVDQIKELWAGTQDQIKQARAMKIEPGLEDTVFVSREKDITSVRGVAVGLEGDSLKFRYGEEDRKINLSKVVGLVLGGQNEAKPDNSFHQSLRLLSDEVISGKLKSLSSDSVEIAITSGGSIKMPISKLARIEFKNGRLVYLSDLKPAQVEQTPYFDRMLGFRIDTSLNGTPLQLSDGPTTRGVAVHSRCVLKYDLGGKFDEFKTKIGFQQPEGKAGVANIRILGDDKVLFEKQDARGDQKPEEVSVKVAGASFLILEVDFGKGQDVGDRIVWANPRLLRGKISE